MTILGIETSQSVCSVGILTERESRERSLFEPNVHSEQVLVLINELCSVQNLDAIAVSSGPGSFTGLRIGLSTAKGLCYSLSIPLVTVPTIHGVVWSYRERHLDSFPIGVCIDAKQGDWYVGCCTIHGDEVDEVFPVTVVSFSKVLELLRDCEIIVTDHIEKIRSAFPLQHVESIYEYLHGTAIARIGKKYLEKGRCADIAYVEPLYLKDFIVKSRTK
ncbi:MAG: tRNA (adenosine(37)-N6)-threonylcarbamoyltransferase complex dimerization subunit type 1 TsaB [Bacteroidetes bacterium]|nr:tRNA (adenosine(37)-N6)-threonylcarbamoyltransferase complex dimerization subunit type 1 TsaB [Bacteroidota bacterium]